MYTLLLVDDEEEVIEAIVKKVIGIHHRIECLLGIQ